MEYVVCETAPILWRGDSPRITLKSYLVGSENLYIAVTQRVGVSTLDAVVSRRRSIMAATIQMEYTCFSWQDFYSKLPAPIRIKSG